MREAIDETREAICRVICPDIGSVGSGFFVSPTTVATCDHVVSHEVPTPSGLVGREFSPVIWVETVSGRYQGQVISAKDGTEPYFHDYCLLELTGFRSRSYLKLAEYSSIHVGDDLVVLGYPLLSPHLVSVRGMVAATPRVPSHINRIINIDVVEIDGAINQGHSGGPAILLNSREVAGIVSIRYGSIFDQVSALRSGLDSSVPTWVTSLLDILEHANTYLNPGLGYAVATTYVRDELRRLGAI